MFKFFVTFGLVSNVMFSILLIFHIDEIVAGQSVNIFLALGQIFGGFASAGVLGNLLGKDGMWK